MRPSECKEFKARLAPYYGYPETHQCSCGGTVTVCDNCGGDWHEDREERDKCSRFKISPKQEILNQPKQDE